MSVSDGWFRALPAGLPAGGYFTLRNTSDAIAVLTGAASPACGMVMLHKSVEYRRHGPDGACRQRHGAGPWRVAFKPGGYHLMCMKPKPAMTPGAEVPVTLAFADGNEGRGALRREERQGRIGAAVYWCWRGTRR